MKSRTLQVIGILATASIVGCSDPACDRLASGSSATIFGKKDNTYLLSCRPGEIGVIRPGADVRIVSDSLEGQNERMVTIKVLDGQSRGIVGDLSRERIRATKD